jgi:hypothetical protein
MIRFITATVRTRARHPPPLAGDPRPRARSIIERQLKRRRQNAGMLHTCTTEIVFFGHSRRRAIVRSEALYRAPRLAGSAHGGLPRATPCLAGVDTAGGFPFAHPPASICRRRSRAGLSPAHNHKTSYVLKTVLRTTETSCRRSYPCGRTALAATSRHQAPVAGSTPCGRT